MPGMKSSCFFDHYWIDYGRAIVLNYCAKNAGHREYFASLDFDSLLLNQWGFCLNLSLKLPRELVVLSAPTSLGHGLLA